MRSFKEEEEPKQSSMEVQTEIEGTDLVVQSIDKLRFELQQKDEVLRELENDLLQKQ